VHQTAQTGIQQKSKQVRGTLFGSHPEIGMERVKESHANPTSKSNVKDYLGLFQILSKLLMYLK
jgi:hypothetical protein